MIEFVGYTYLYLAIDLVIENCEMMQQNKGYIITNVISEEAFHRLSFLFTKQFCCKYIHKKYNTTQF